MPKTRGCTVTKTGGSVVEIAVIYFLFFYRVHIIRCKYGFGHVKIFNSRVINKVSAGVDGGVKS